MILVIYYKKSRTKEINKIDLFRKFLSIRRYFFSAQCQSDHLMPFLWPSMMVTGWLNLAASQGPLAK